MRWTEMKTYLENDSEMGGDAPMVTMAQDGKRRNPPHNPSIDP